MFLYGIFGLGFAGGLAAFTYRDHNTLTNLAILGGIAVVLVNLIFLVHLLLANFRRGGNFSRILLFLLGLESWEPEAEQGIICIRTLLTTGDAIRYITWASFRQLCYSSSSTPSFCHPGQEVGGECPIGSRSSKLGISGETDPERTGDRESR
jgi:hypothetical protein